MTSAHDVADELRQQLPGIGTLKLHKLLYYAAGWHVTWHDEQLFREPVKAWLMGPVVAELWADEQHSNRKKPNPQPLSDQQLATLDFVIDRYGGLSGNQLKEKTHEEAPWRDVSEADVPAEAGGSDEITLTAMRAFFREDPDFVRYRSEAARLIERLGDDPFALPTRTQELSEAIEESLVPKQPLPRDS